MGDTLGIVSLYSHAWEWTISTNGLMTVRASSAHGTRKKKNMQMTPWGNPGNALQCSQNHELGYTEFGNEEPTAVWSVSSEMLWPPGSFSVRLEFACGHQTTPLSM